MPTLPALINALLDPHCYDHPVERVEVIETHISWVLLTGTLAYKIKKPINLGFLDFSTLEKRRRCCEAEVSLNRRLAPEIYLGVAPIAGTPAQPQVGGHGEIIEYAVKMRQWPQAAQLDRVLSRGELQPVHIEALAAVLARFHAAAAVAGEETPFGTPERVYQPMAENFEQIRKRVPATLHPQLARLEDWSMQTHARLRDFISSRKHERFVRECHGDAHLANMALLDGQVVLFDCIEFNDNLRWIDVMNEVAFVAMDLEDRGRADFARRLLNGYVEHTGDFGGLRLLRFYEVYRALVRAKVAAIRLGQPGIGAQEHAHIQADYRGYADLAERYTRAQPRTLLITYGVSGTGKTYLARQLVERLDAVQIRSDVERKRLHGLAIDARGGGAIEAGIYSAEASRRTYERLRQLADDVLQAGLPAIVDATFLRRDQRTLFRELARVRDARFVILSFEAPLATLRERVARRARAERDASEANLAVLEHQLATAEALDREEQVAAVAVSSLDATALEKSLATVLARLKVE